MGGPFPIRIVLFVLCFINIVGGVIDETIMIGLGMLNPSVRYLPRPKQNPTERDDIIVNGQGLLIDLGNAWTKRSLPTIR